MSWTFVIISFLVAFMVILMCLFPLSPIWFKKLILYFCLAILGLFFVVGVVRVFVFAVVWIVFGRHFWVLPNITSDEIPIDEVFSPMWAFDDLDANGNVVGKISAINRLAAAGSAGAARRRRGTRSRRRSEAPSSPSTARTARYWTCSTCTTPPRGSRGRRRSPTAAANAAVADDARRRKRRPTRTSRRNRRGGPLPAERGRRRGHRTSDIDPLA